MIRYDKCDKELSSI